MCDASLLLTTEESLGYGLQDESMEPLGSPTDSERSTSTNDEDQDMDDYSVEENAPEEQAAAAVPASPATFASVTAAIEFVSPGNSAELIADVLLQLRSTEVALPANERPAYPRGLLLEWTLMIGSDKMGVSTETLHATVNYIDNFFLRHTHVTQRRARLFGLACLWLAAKGHEKDEISRNVDELNALTNNAFDVRDIVRAEALVCKVLDWKLVVVTPVSFASIFVQDAIDDATDRRENLPIAGSNLLPHLHASMHKYTEFFMHLSFQDFALACLLPSCVAAAAIAASRKALSLEPMWPERMAVLTNYCVGGDPQHDITPVIEHMWNLHKNYRRDMTRADLSPQGVADGAAVFDAPV